MISTLRHKKIIDAFASPKSSCACFLIVLAASVVLPAPLDAGQFTFDTSTIYTANGVQGDPTVGDKFVSGQGWYVPAGAESTTPTSLGNEWIRERPLDTNGFVAGSGAAAGKFIHPGKYYAYLDIKTAEWGFDSNAGIMAFRFTMYGNHIQNDKDAETSWDSSGFAESAMFRIILGDDDSGKGSLMLSTFGDNSEVYKSNTSGDFDSKGGQAWSDEVGNLSMNTTGYQTLTVDSDGKIKDQTTDPDVLWARFISGGVKEAMPTVEILFDYETYNANNGAWTDWTPDDISFLVFESNKGSQDVGNYRWKEEYPSVGTQGTPYAISAFQNVYELDRLLWQVPEPTSLVLTAMGMLVLFIGVRKRPD